MGFKKEDKQDKIYFKEKQFKLFQNDLNILSQTNNQDLEIYLGLDIAKEFHYLSLLINIGNDTKIYDLGEIKNTNEGFLNLEKIFNEITGLNISKNKVYIGMEATGSYHFSLLNFLNKNKFENTYVINPAKIKQFKKAIINTKSKTDKEDSITIVNYMFTYKNYLEKDEIDDEINENSNSLNKKISNPKNNIFGTTKNNQIYKTRHLETSNLRFLYRQYFKEKKELSRIKTRIKELTNRIMPEIYEVFNPNKYSKMELYIKSNFTREEIINLDETDFYNQVMIGTNNKEWNKKSYPIKLKKLQEILKTGIGIDDDYGFLKRQMNIYVSKYQFIEQNIEEMTKLIELELNNKNLFIPKIYGVSPILLGVFYSEYGNHLYSKSIKELVGFIGWYPVEISSGGKSLAKPRLQTKGNYILRHTVYLIIYSLTAHISEINEYKNYIKIKKNIKSRQALIESSSKILRIILSLLKNKQDFDLEEFKKHIEIKKEK